MHLRFTDQELATLVEMVCLATNVSSWNQKPGADERAMAYEDLENKVLEKAKHAGLGELIEFDEEKQQHRVTAEFQDKAFFQECYEEFRAESFWEELVIRLADRDLIRVIGMEQWQKLSEEDRRAHTQDVEKRYWDEFTKNGIDRLAVIFPPLEA